MNFRAQWVWANRNQGPPHQHVVNSVYFGCPGTWQWNEYWFTLSSHPLGSIALFCLPTSVDETRVVEIILTLKCLSEYWPLTHLTSTLMVNKVFIYIVFIMQKTQARLVILFETVEIGSLYKANTLLNSFEIHSQSTICVMCIGL